MNKLVTTISVFIIIPLIALSGIYLFNDQQYNLISIGIILVSLIVFYLKYEKSKPKNRELVILSVMISMIVFSRIIFMVTPSFKPTIALIIIYAMNFGSNSGFVCGSLSAFMSNFFYGQGPWTPFQMIACGIIGFLAGVLNKKGILTKNKYIRVAFGIVASIFYSMVMDVWSVLVIDQSINVSRYLTVLVSSLPVTIIYISSTITFLLMLYPILSKKMIRIKLKYGLIEGEIYEENIS